MRKGFTLSEVLITLGIIGVVAALTLPSVIASYQKQVTVNKLKKFYTNMNQVFTFAQAKHGEYLIWKCTLGSTPAQLQFYNEYIKPYIKHTGNIQKGIHSIGDYNPGLKFEFLNGTQAVLVTQGSNFMVYEGNPRETAIIFYTNTGVVGESPRDNVKNPTHEKFYFYINDKGQLVPPGMHKTRVENIASCKQSYNIDCATVIIKDGWKISDDYPW